MSDGSQHAVHGRELRRALGAIASAALADLLDDAASSKSPTVSTSARRLADNLGISKDSAARALRVLASAGLIERLPSARAKRGRFGRASYRLSADILPASAAPAALEVVRRTQRRATTAEAMPSQPSLFDTP
jgi:predicted ArsR family transcriptional regulator